MSKTQEENIVPNWEKNLDSFICRWHSISSQQPRRTTKHRKKVWKVFRKYRGLKLDIEKTKYMKVKKSGGKLLEMRTTKNHGNEAHMKNLKKKAMMVLIGKVWGIAERNLKEEWAKRMYLFDVLVESIVMYGVEIWGWKKHKELEGARKIHKMDTQH